MGRVVLPISNRFWPETGDVNFVPTPNTSSKHITITKPALADSLRYPVFIIRRA